MKSNTLRHSIAILLSLITVISIMSVPLTASARYTDEDIENKISYHDLNCREDDCDCLEPENNKFAVVSPRSETNTYDDYILVDTYQNVQKYFDEQGWTDGLPIVPPTWIKAEKFMRYTPYADNDIVASVNDRSVTAYQVAANAIMSGCSAEYLPVCIAFVEALGDTEYLDSLRSGELTPMMYVNGPIARQLGIDNGQGMTTEECNIAIARFMELALINLAGIERTNSFGNVQPLVFSEDEQNCINIGWDPHHVEAGYDLNDNVITATSFAMWGNNITPATDLPEEIMKVIAWDITEKNLGGLGGASAQDNADAKRTILITPSVAQALAKKYQTKDALENALVENARRPLWMRTYAYYYTNVGTNLIGSKSFSDVYDELKAIPSEDAKLTASPSWMNGITYANIDTVATMTKGNTDIIIQGDESRNKTQVMPGGVSVSKEIQLDTTWDDLLASMIISIVYQPLSAHYITPVDDSVKLPTGSAIPTVLQVTKQTTYRIAASATYVNGTGRIYFDSATDTLYYWDGSAAQSVVIDTDTYSDFVAFVEALGINSTFKLDRNNNVIETVIRFSSNKSLPDKNAVEFTQNSFGTIVPTIAANATSGSNGNASIDGSTITMNDTVTTFTADLGGDIVMGGTTDAGFVSVSGTTVTVNSNAPAGATAVIGTADGSGTYRTMTIVNGGDGTYKLTYNTANTLTLTASSYYLKGTFNNWEAKDAFVKTDNDDILTVIKEIPAGTYTFKVHNAGSDTWYGNGGTITDTAYRWTMDSSSDCTFKASGGTYEFKYEISTNRLSVYPAQTDAVVEVPTTKTVYVGVIEYIKDFVPTLHYWNDSGLAGDATLTATGETAKYSVGSSYWSGAEQNFTVYKTTIPADATKMKTFKAEGNTNWAAEESTYSENMIILLFEYSNVYHNQKNTYFEPEPVVTYTVTFKNWDGTTLATRTVEEGKAATAPTAPTRPATNDTVYTFSGWDKEFTNITSDLVVTALYTESVRKYTVTFKDFDGTKITSVQVEYGESATAPDAPTREADAQYTYTFSGWDKEFTNITSDLTVTAKYSTTTNKYTVTFLDWNDEVLDTQTVEYGKAATAPANPTREDDENYTYSFTGWDTDFSKITGNTTVTAEYSSTQLITIYFTNDKAWDKVYCSAWYGSGSAPMPGTEMTYVTTNSYGSEVYSVKVPVDIDNVVFNGGSNSNKTVTITDGIANNIGFYPTKLNSSNSWLVGSYVNGEEEIPPYVEFVFDMDVTAPNYVEVGTDVVINATTNSTATVTYELYTDADQKVDTNTTGVFRIKTTEDQIGESYTYYVVATTEVQDKTHTLTSEKFTYTVGTAGDTWTVSVYFKSSSSLGYRPLLTTTGAIEDLEYYDMVKDQFLGTNKTQSGYYYWYKAEVVVSKDSPQLTLNVLSRRYAMEGTVTVTISDKKNELYLGIDDLNSGTEMVDLSECSEAERNWYSSAVHMVYDAKYDGELTATSMNLRQVGDSNNDGTVNIKDATAIQKHLAELQVMDKISADVSDADSDYSLTIKDATTVQKKIAGLI
ncbi:MAG: hypothetical protein IJD93_03415 [Ruminococcus sp.]|nr:hypothetical protein [Ruminococcus sp.]